MSIRKKISIFIFIAAIFGTLSVGTQTFAKNVKYHKSLGKYLFLYKNKTPIYSPFKILSWLKFEKKAPRAMDNAYTNMGMTAVISFLLIALINYRKKKVVVHGSAEWANKSEIDKMGFFPYKKNEAEIEYEKSGTIELYKKRVLEKRDYIKLEFPSGIIKRWETVFKCLIMKNSWKKNEYFKNGVFIGRDEYGRDLIDLSSGHVMMIAKTGGGKGVSVVLTTLWTWKGSSLVNDIKGENWLYTAAYRRAIGHKVFRFHATADGVSSVSCHYNPLSEIRKGTLFEFQDAYIIAETIVSPDKLKDKYFGPNGVTFLTAVILHVLYMKKIGIANLSDVYNFLTAPQFSEEEKLEQMISGEHNSEENEGLFEEIYDDLITLKNGDESPRTHPKVSRIGADILGRPEKERGGIMSTAKTELFRFSIPTIAKNTAYSDFKISDLMNDEVPMDLYFVTPPNSVDITSVLLKLFLNQIIFTLTNNMKLDKKGTNIAYKHRLLFLLDELPAIGKVDLFHKAISYIRGYGMKALIIIQDMKQLKEVYGENNSFLGNMSTTIYYSTNDVDTAKYIETRLGNKAERLVTKSYSPGLIFRKVSYNESYVGRPLMTAGEIHNMTENESIILAAGKKPIKGKLARWYEDLEFKNRFARGEQLTDASASDIIKEYKKWEDLKTK